jgi:hypothetical protein
MRQSASEKALLKEIQQLRKEIRALTREVRKAQESLRSPETAHFEPDIVPEPEKLPE